LKFDLVLDEVAVLLLAAGAVSSCCREVESAGAGVEEGGSSGVVSSGAESRDCSSSLTPASFLEMSFAS